MPELPEVETIARQLHPLTMGLVIQRLEVLDQRLGTLPTAELPGRRVTKVFRLGKQVVFELAYPHQSMRWLVVHLRMTGRLIWSPTVQNNSMQNNPMKNNLAKHLRARLLLESGVVSFFDPRRFGTIQILSALKEVQPTGVDPTTPAFTVMALTRLLTQTQQELKTWLLRQDRLVGLGNIYAAEILFEARLDPRQQAGSLSRPEIQRLHRSIRKVLTKAIRHCGTTFSDFQNAEGRIGGYQKYLKVYQREGEPCAVCGEAIARLSQQGRSTFFCPRCQCRPRRG